MPSFSIWQTAMTRRAGLASQMSETRRGEIPCTAIGQGVLVLHSHGSPAGCDIGPLMLAGLADKGCRGITPSRSGFLKTHLSAGKTPREQADTFATFLDALALERVAVHAWSAGGPPALQFALRPPERISSLVLLAAVAHKWEHCITLFERLMMNDRGLWLLNTLRSFMPGTFRKRSAQEPGANYTCAKTQPEKLELPDAFFIMTAPASLRLKGALNDIKQYRKLAEYPLEITCPTLVVFSETDAQLPISRAEHAAKRIPNAEYKLIKGGHLPQADEDADYLVDLIANFIFKHLAHASMSSKSVEGRALYV